jgi:hypothetical protein
MKIDLSKYPLGTKFKLKNGETVILVGKSHISDDYLIEHIREKYYIPDCPAVTYRRQDGTAANSTGKYDIESVIQSDKYLVSYKDQSNTIRTIVVANPRALTIDSFYKSVKSVTSEYRQPYDILSWSKIEE